MAPFVLFTLVIAVFLTELVKGQTGGYFTDTPPVDYFQRKSLGDCHSRFYPNPYKHVYHASYGGERATVGEFQHMAAIGWTSNGKSEYLCGGTLLSSKFVLTAAHCAVNGNGKQPDTVRLGDTNLASIEDDVTAQQIKILSVKKHPQYRPSRKYFDIAVIELETEARFDKATCSACLWLEKEVPSEEMIAIGFGATGYSKSLSPTLQKVKLSAIDKAICVEQLPVSRRALPDGFVDEQFCAGSDHMDTCEGDSGGPIQIEKADVDGNLIPLIVGIVSFGTPCTNGSLGVYTRVASYREWIEQEIQQPIDYLTCTRTSYCWSRKHVNTGIDQFELSIGPIIRVGLLWNASELNVYQCGATLIDYRFALTSAFCAQEKRGQPQFIIVESTKEMVEIDSVFIHPQFSPEKEQNDIALLKLTKYLKHDNILVPACLVKDNKKSNSFEMLQYSAFSTRFIKKELYREDDYQQYYVKSSHNEDCSNLEFKQDNLFCRKKSINLIPTVCNMDYGGPVLKTDIIDDVPYLYGVVSKFSKGCSEDMVAIKVSPYAEWIEKIVLDQTGDRLVFL